MDSRRSIATISCALAALVALGVAAPAPARAQTVDADGEFARGKRLMEDGKLDDACEAFEASNRIDPRAGTLIWIGECRARNHQLGSAWAAYREALARVKDPRKRAIASGKLAALEDRLSYLLVVVAEDRRLPGLTLTRDGQPLDVDTWNRGVPTDGGDYAITASAPGHAAWSTTVTVPAELGRIRVDVPRLDELAPPAPPPPERPAPPPAAPSVPRSPASPPSQPPSPAPASAVPTLAAAATTGARDAGPPSSWTARRKVALGLAVVGVAGWATGAVLGLQASHRQSDALALCPSDHDRCGYAPRANQLLDDASRRALGANIAFGVAAAATIGTSILWLTGAPEASHSVAIVPTVAPTGAGLALRGRL